MKKMTRRDFLKGMTASSLGIAAMGIIDSNVIMPAAAQMAAGWDGTYIDDGPVWS